MRESHGAVLEFENDLPERYPSLREASSAGITLPWTGLTSQHEGGQALWIGHDEEEWVQFGSRQTAAGPWRVGTVPDMGEVYCRWFEDAHWAGDEQRRPSLTLSLRYTDYRGFLDGWHLLTVRCRLDPVAGTLRAGVVDYPKRPPTYWPKRDEAEWGVRMRSVHQVGQDLLKHLNHHGAQTRAWPAGSSPESIDSTAP